MIRRLNLFLCLPVLLACLLVLASPAAAAESSREVPIRVEPELKSLGINAANSTIACALCVPDTSDGSSCLRDSC